MVDKEKINFTQDSGAGFEGLEAQDFAPPFLILLQSGSPQLKEGHELYNAEARPGRIFNTNSGICYRACHVIPIRYTFRNVEWKPRNSGGGFVASHERQAVIESLEVNPLDGKTYRHGNLIQPTGYYLALLQEESWDRVIIPMASTQLKKSRRWNSLMIAQKQDDSVLPMFANVYTLSVVQESNSQGSWYGWRIDWNTIITDPQLYNMAKETNQKQINFLPERLIASLHQTEDNGEKKEGGPF